ncbi:methylmalonyl-CoA mutase family protein [Trinickia mobilis]|uniref:methylmalonyl-CoA mutase family protein n=1 Tax=Trinickia mobilis TaxID=2816356 RepID=UPI001A9090CF|nr:methylmalonyl-CoA mutase family protein [Trinickia mobilis]
MPKTDPITPSSPRRDEIKDRLRQWREGTLPKGMTSLGLDGSEEVGEPGTPLLLEGHDFLQDVGLPGEYPFTSWLYPTRALSGGKETRTHRAGRYSGYGTSGDCRDYYRDMRAKGFAIGGANIASDLPSQLGWDSDNPRAIGEVGRVGVAIDSLRDFEVLFEAFRDEFEIDRISTNWTINAPAIVYVAFYCALAIKRGIALDKLRCTPQNDILKEYCGRGQYIFPPRPSMRLIRDVIVFMHERMPRSNPISICAEHIRYAGATTVQSFAFAFANAKEYVRTGIRAGLPVDSFVKRFTYRGFGDSTLNFLYGIAAPRAARRIWARIMREEFHAREDRSCILRGGEHAWGNSYMRMTDVRPVNNIARATIEAIIQATASGEIAGGVPFDEPLGLGHSLEAQQVSRDIARIVQHEAQLSECLDPFAGSYVIESLTNKIEEETVTELENVERLGGAIAAIETGYYRTQVSASAWEAQRLIESGENIWVGVNRFNGPEEIDTNVSRTPEYRASTIDTAEERQLKDLRELRQHRDHKAVASSLTALAGAARDEQTNLLPHLIDCALAYATIGEICDVLRDVFGEAASGAY